MYDGIFNPNEDSTWFTGLDQNITWISTSEFSAAAKPVHKLAKTTHGIILQP